ncbi:glutamine amidotransferase [Kocuria sp.]|uniref:glutamine amidotransferase n=1 Tax=Kocuria sp. TaxID=1871328 RepID=UPI0026DF38B8|nr:glutamine amidotransferase [Kocuria sp.]MDO5617865.1 glutamine amidotransferase [Kocuria sp.]
MLPFLLVSTRPEDAVAEEEYETFCRFAGLAPQELHHLRLEQGEDASRALAATDLSRYSGVFVGGSPFNTSLPQEQKSATQVRVELSLGELLDRVMDHEIPFFGACYGVGTLGVHQGGVVDSTYGEEVGAISVTVTEDGARDPLLAELPREFFAYVGHKEAIRELPPQAVLLATGVNCPVQMFRVGPNAYATQFHPELDAPALIRRIEAYKHHGYFLLEEAESVKQQVHSGPAVEAPAALLRAFVTTFAR